MIFTEEKDGQCALDDEPEGYAPHKQPELGHCIPFIPVQGGQDAKGSHNDAGRRNHVSHGTGRHTDIGGQIVRKAALFHGRDGEDTGGSHIACSAAGQGAHETGHKKRHITGTAFNAAKDGQDYFHTGIDYFGSCKYLCHDHEGHNGVKQGIGGCLVYKFPCMAPLVGHGQHDNETSQHPFINRTFQDDKENADGD